jgi:hypothetical protein
VLIEPCGVEEASLTKQFAAQDYGSVFLPTFLEKPGSPLLGDYPPKASIQDETVLNETDFESNQE